MAGLYFLATAPFLGAGAGTTETVTFNFILDFSAFASANVKVGFSGHVHLTASGTGTARLRTGGTYNAADGTIVASAGFPAATGSGYGLEFIFVSNETTIANPGGQSFAKITMQATTAGTVTMHFPVAWVREA